jgi:hypothetical protein
MRKQTPQKMRLVPLSQLLRHDTFADKNFGITQLERLVKLRNHSAAEAGEM